ncbi:1760_t:CDS:2, partial [Paraglomus brasilianum]
TVSEKVKKKLEKITEEAIAGLQSGVWFQSNDPYVIVFDATAKEVARTKIAPSTNNPIWEE